MPIPVVVRIDGCPGWGPGERSWAWLPFANPVLARAGLLTVAVSVRHSGQAVFPAQLHDVRAALRWIRRNPLGLPIDPRRIGIWGQSAGGHLAALAGLVRGGTSGPGRTAEPDVRARSRRTGEPVGCAGSRGTAEPEVRAVVTISGPSDLLRQGGDLRVDRPSPVTTLVGGDVRTHREQLRAASPITQVAAGAPPFLIVHGTADETVPYEHAERLHHALLAVGARSRLLPIVGGDHDLRDDRYAVANEAARFFREAL
ncbi:prolyl oligopeptidase family serine peptidase [Kribbella sp.]|uniref:prolyl oligopeptidase family serine peptidase n=1 Tax=Kribbella sp. TaxID=1871183 RepID=UPI002D4BAEB3|nr:prolyl oligopeptidase family serine peptidase [Kribbella sp.]HZX05768.1 prolyl oligopeptidase family serine peptidase [Kribbella sp.]